MEKRPTASYLRGGRGKTSNGAKEARDLVGLHASGYPIIFQLNDGRLVVPKAKTSIRPLSFFKGAYKGSRVIHSVR